MNELERQIEAAFDYRGHVTVKFKDGTAVEGYLFNREFANPVGKEEQYIDLMPKDSEERKRFRIDTIASVELTGKDFAAGNSFEDYLRKKNG